MPDPTDISVEGIDGLRAHAKSVPPSGSVELTLDDGRTVRVPVNLLSRRTDTSYFLSLRRGDLQQKVESAAGPTEIGVGKVVIPIVQEALRIDKKVIETGHVAVHVVPHTRTEVVDLPLSDERVEIERVPSDRIVDRAEPSREDGDVTIIPVYEEILVVERKLRLKEEVRIRRVKTVHHERHEVELRAEEVKVMRSDGSSAGSGTNSANSLQDRPSMEPEPSRKKEADPDFGTGVAKSVRSSGASL